MNNYCSIRLILFLATALWLASPLTTLALDPRKAVTQYVHDAWQIENGLPQNTVQAIAQTRDGYLWFGTQEGLARFDGVHFTVLHKGNTGAMKNNSINALLERRDGSLWIGTSDGLSRLRGGELTTYTTNDGLSHNSVRVIYEDAEGSLWIGTDTGLNRLQDGRFTSYTTRDGLSNDTVFAVRRDRQGTLWVGTGSGLNRYSNGTFTPSPGGVLADAVVHQILEDHAGGLWIGTYGKGLSRLQDGHLTTYTTLDGLSGNMVRTLHEDRHGNLWIGTDGGLNRYQHDRFTDYGMKEGLSNNVVMAIYEDLEGSVWVGTHGGGVNCLKDGKFTLYTMRDGLAHDVVRTVYQDQGGRIWIGTDGGGLSRLEANKVTTYTTRDGLSHNMVRAIVEARDGALWVGTYGGGVNRFQNGKFTHYTTKNGLTNDLVRAVYEDRAGRLWIGTYGGGLNCFEGGKFVSYTTAEGLSSNMVFAIHEDREGTLWITTRGGLNRLRDGKFTHYTTKDGLSSDLLFSIHEDRDGALWIGTSGGGLNRFKDGKFTAYTTKNGLFDDLVYRVLEDDHGTFWMSCNRGIFSVSKRELDAFAAGKISSITSTSYGQADGMKSIECNGGSQPAGWKTSDGRLWFPTIKGVVVINPKELLDNRLPPPVVIENLIVDNRPVGSNGQVELPAGSEKLEVHYTGLSFIAPEKVRFRYKLVGIDREWIDAGTRRTAYYTNLPPGSYHFQVIACNSDGVWNEAGASVSLYLRPHFYQTYWFYLLCAFAVLVSARGIYRLRVRQLKRREQALTQIVEERTQQLNRTNEALESQAQQLAAANEKLHRLSYMDGLTGVANRRRFDELLADEWRRAARAGTALSLVMIDIDYFKRFNDAYGHQQGDECLKRVAAALSLALGRGGDVVARYGGEEFAVLVPGTDASGVAAIAAKLRASVEELQITNADSACGGVVTISMGGATVYPSDQQASAELILAADQALYQAKHAGRNQFVSAESAVATTVLST